tara:strand:+ start:166 stop:384 length:219 start_codon:yes stop_codon:yes gene_type:complete
MSFSIKIFETGKLVRFKSDWLRNNDHDPQVAECQFGIILGAATAENHIVYKIYWFPINKIFYDDYWRIELYE